MHEVCNWSPTVCVYANTPDLRSQDRNVAVATRVSMPCAIQMNDCCAPKCHCQVVLIQLYKQKNENKTEDCTAMQSSSPHCESLHVTLNKTILCHKDLADTKKALLK